MGMTYGVTRQTWFWCAVFLSTRVFTDGSVASHGVWRPCSIKDAFLTLWNINLQDCVNECQARSLCAAVSYSKTNLACSMMATVTMETFRENTTQACVYIKKTDVSHLPEAARACPSCGNETFCDTQTGNCVIKECRKLEIDNAIIRGNVLRVGSKAIVECLDLFYLDPSNASLVCLETGNWSIIPQCIPSTACGTPPIVTNAMVDTLDRVAETVSYVCVSGYSSLTNVTGHMTLTCTLVPSWSGVNFTCITCGPPPAVTNANAVAVNASANGIDYECSAGFSPTSSDMTVVCKADGTWSAIGFTCNTMCPLGWDNIGTSCYYIQGLGTVMQYYDALSYCSGQGGYLLQLETQTESDAMKTYLMNNYGVANWWMGLSDLDSEGNWLWATDGTTSTFNDWLALPDEGRAANFAMIENTAGWEDVARNELCVVICEKAPL